VTRTEKIRVKLEEAFSPRVLEVIDDSESHRGHSGYREGGESHFNVVIEAEKLSRGKAGSHVTARCTRRWARTWSQKSTPWPLRSATRGRRVGAGSSVVASAPA
jgi:hypothetical protein